MAMAASDTPPAWPWKPSPAASSVSTRSSSTRAAPFEATDRNVVTSMLAPSNTSGHQKWNGTAEILKPTPTIRPKIATASSAAPPAPSVPECAIAAAISET